MLLKKQKKEKETKHMIDKGKDENAATNDDSDVELEDLMVAEQREEEEEEEKEEKENAAIIDGIKSILSFFQL